jgi:hypothetical protein
MASNALFEGANTVSDAFLFPRRSASSAVETTASNVWNSSVSETISITVFTDEGGLVGLSVGTTIGIKVIGGMGGVGKSVGGIGLGICDAIDGAIAGRFDSGRKLGVGVGEIEGTLVGIEVEVEGGIALGGLVGGRAVVGNAVGSISLLDGGDPVGFAVGDCVMLESVSYFEVHSLNISLSSSEIPLESLPRGIGIPSCRSRSRLLPLVVAAEQYPVRAKESSKEITTVVLRSFMLVVATTRYVVRRQHGRLNVSVGKDEGRRNVSARYWRMGSRSYSSRRKNVFRQIWGGRARMFARRCEFHRGTEQVQYE